MREALRHSPRQAGALRAGLGAFTRAAWLSSTASQARVCFLSDFYLGLLLFVLIVVPKAEGSILSTKLHSV